MSTFLLADGEELKSEVAEKLPALEGLDEGIDLEGRLDAVAVKIGRHALILVGDLVVAADELPLPIRLHIDSKATILQLALEVVD